MQSVLSKELAKQKGQQKIKFVKARKLQQDEEVVLVNGMILYIYVYVTMHGSL